MSKKTPIIFPLKIPVKIEITSRRQLEMLKDFSITNDAIWRQASKSIVPIFANDPSNDGHNIKNISIYEMIEALNYVFQKGMEAIIKEEGGLD
jgi:hypothetical protein